MDWSCLGHAMWLVEAEGLRLLFDPLLTPTHHEGVFEVRPRRSVDAGALRADFILVSHKHGDHFDVESLRALAALDPDSVVVTPDELVVWAAKKLGFRTAHLVPPGQRVELDGLQIVTTPSVAELEWGALVATADATVWNQVDTVFESPEQLASIMAEAMTSLGRPADARLDLGLVAWQPMLEIAAVTCERTAFPRKLYDSILRQIAALSPRTVAPTACGARHVGPHAWMDSHVYPVREERFLRDVAAVVPTTRALPNRVGGLYRVGPDGVTLDDMGARGLVDVEPGEVELRYDPFSVPELMDPDRGRADIDTMRGTVERWIEGTLGPALHASYPSMGVDCLLTFTAEVVWPDTTDAWSIAVDSRGATVRRSLDPDWDVLNRVAGSLLFEVIEGRFHWGDVLLGGMLRAVSRAYEATAEGLARANVGKTFLYYGLPYDQAVRRAVIWEVEHGSSG